MTKCIVVGTHVAGLGVIRSLGEMGVEVVALHYLPSEMGHLSRHVRQRARVAHPEAHVDRFMDFLVAARHLHGGLLVPTEDAAMGVLAQRKAELAPYYSVALPEWGVVQKIIEKKYTYELAERLGIPCPRTHLPTSLEEAVAFASEVGYPCLVKPSVSHRFSALFGTKMVEVADRRSLVATCALAWGAGLEVMVQELIPGDDTQGVNYNSYFWESQPLAEFTASKVRLAPARFGFPRVVVSHHVPEVAESGRALLRALGFYGFSCMEFKRDPRDGRHKLMEVNGRHNVSSRLAVKCGLNFPYLMYQHLTTGRFPAPASPRPGVYWIDEFKDLIYSAGHLWRERYPLAAYLKPYLSPHVFATFALDDPLPFLARSLYLAGRGLAALGRKLNSLRKVSRGDEKRREEARIPAPRWLGS